MSSLPESPAVCGGRGSPLRLPVIALLAALLVACGFQLRGSYDIPADLQPLRVDAGGEFGDALERVLRTGGVELTRERDQAAATLRVTDRSEERRVLAIREDGRVDEYELVYRVTWHLAPSGGGGDPADHLIAATRYSGERSYIFDPGSRLAADDEEEVLREILREDLADRILRRLEAWSPDQVSADGD